MKTVYAISICIVVSLPSVSRAENPTHALLAKKSVADQAYFLGVVVESVGDSCKGTKPFFRGFNKETGAAYWSVRCSNGSTYQVEIAADATGSTNVLDCKMLELLGGKESECFTKF
jgi:hypothetical protein